MSLVTGSDGPSRPGVKLTYDDFVLFPDDGKRHELIDGEHYVTPSPHLKVKVGSPSTRRRDEKLKHQLYERFDVRLSVIFAE